MVLYAHRKLKSLSVFYIGIGNDKRPYDKKDRNFFWHNTVARYGLDVQILITGLTKEQAISWERYLIGLYGRRDLNTGVLVNLTDGGDGVSSWVPNKEWRLKQSAAKRGIKRSEEVKAKISKTKTGVKNPKISGEKNHNYGKKPPDYVSPKARKCVNKESGLVVVGVKKVCEITGLKYSTIVSWMNGSNKSPNWFPWEYQNETN